MKAFLTAILALGCFAASTVHCQHSVSHGVFLTSELGETFRYALETNKLQSPSVRISAPEVKLAGLSYVVQFARMASNLTIYLNLVCLGVTEPKHIQASIKLLGTQNADEKSLVKTVSNHLVERHRCAPIVINDFMLFDRLSDYAKNGNVTFEIEFAANQVHPSLRPKEFGVVGKKLLFEIKNLDVGSMKQITTTPFVVRDILWTLHVVKGKANSIGVYLSADLNSELNPWSYSVDATITLLPFIEKVDPIKYTFTHSYSAVSPIHGIYNFVNATDLYDKNKQYAFKNMLNLLVEIHVE